MAILTNSGGVQLTNNAGKPLVYDTGSILKIEYNSVNTQTISNTSGYVDSTVFVNIYPTNASSKILIEANFFAFQLPIDPITSTTKVAPVSFRFTRTIGGTTTYLENVGELGGDFGFAGEENSTETFNSIGMLTKLLYVDSPNTTTTITYRVQFRNFAEPTYSPSDTSASIGHDRTYNGLSGGGGGAYNNPSPCKSIIIATEFSA